MTAPPTARPTVLVDVTRVFPDNPRRAAVAGVVVAERIRWDEPVVLGWAVCVVGGGFNRRGGCPDRPRLAAAPGTVLLVPGIPADHPDLMRPGIDRTNPPQGPKTRYDRIGEDQLAALVATFCATVAMDDRLARYVTRVDMTGVRQHLTFLLVKLLGGPQPYDRTSMLRRAHHRHYVRLRVRRHDYGRLCNHMSAALNETGVDVESSAYLMARFWAGMDEFSAAD